MRRLLTLTILSSSLLLVGCGGPTDEELARQEIFETNVANAPEWTDEIESMIHESRGVVIAEEEGEDEKEIIEVRNSFSPGDEVVKGLSSYTREELLQLDSTSHMEIFINGVIRDEYSVAAHTLYGAEEVQAFKESFREALLKEYPPQQNGAEIPDGTRYIDLIGLKTAIQDHDVARHHVDVIINQLNRIFVKIVPLSDFGDKVVVEGVVYPIELRQQLQEVEDATFEFTGIKPEKYRNRMTDDQIMTLNEYHIETFGNALLQSPISETRQVQSEIGGFTQREDGTWVPAKMELFSWNLVSLIYGI